ncbi:DNRLRE domain-containing protein [Paenibacillus sp. 1011MAR3C5]|uniref:DNRLRE domain-containing protein n=1 Tax=Paenibacillus sp. 1011MAR3C5 TaxID=1675787 RepID=UPI000E6D2F95|nr:DNRLRE domain-containing protein [Paenibacillus sp. 1011MAR3C5]RJE90662.1 DNRLRE domain-containing protein [Paenibacillus sp. 1011MAR3C5]
MDDEYEYDLEAIFAVRTLSNKIEGVFKLYAVDDSDIETSFVVATRDNSDLDMELSVKVRREADLNSTFDVKYRDSDDIEATFEVVGSSYLESTLEIRPNNRMFGRFELLPAPRVNQLISSVEDSTTRSREDLRTLNYGDSQKMMIGRIFDADLGEDYLESFVKFGDVSKNLMDLAILEEASLRLYYTGDFYDTVNIELCLPNQNWQERGITHANKPLPSELITDKFTINKDKRYIEFDIKETFMHWFNGDIKNFGFLIRSNNGYSTSFYTRESSRPPVLNINYISDQVYSAGRSEIESTMFIIGKGYSDINATFEVHSDYGFDEREATLYVHRAEVPLEEDLDSLIAISKPDQNVTFRIALRDEDDKDITIAVIAKKNEEFKSYISVSRPEIDGMIAVDPNISMPITIEVKGEEKEDFVSFLTVTRGKIELGFKVRAIDHGDLSSTIEVPNYDYLDSVITVSNPDLEMTFDIHTIDLKDVTFVVKEKEYLDATFLVYQHSNLDMSFDIKYANEIDATFVVSKPELSGYFYPRAIGEDELELTYQIRQLDASDLDIFLTVKGEDSGAYYFIL